MAKEPNKLGDAGDAPDETPTEEIDSQANIDRRSGGDRRKRNIPVAFDRRKGGDRRSGERRRQVDPTTCERDYTPDELEFMMAINEYKREFHRPFPTWSEVLEVLVSLGYRKVAEPTDIAPNRARAAPPPTVFVVPTPDAPTEKAKT